MASSFLNIDYDNLPKRVQALVDGLPSEQRPPCCIQCRGAFVEKPLRCSRCTVAHYCSKDCQRNHFSFHKVQCKRIGKKMDMLLSTSTAPPREGSNITGILRYLADALVVMGYRESDTIVNGALYYRRALKYYMKIYKNMEGQFFHDDSHRLEDKALMLMIVLGGDSKILLEWCMFSGSPRFVNFMPPAVEAPPEFQTQGLAGNDFTFQSLCLLTSMRSLAQYRRDRQAYETLQEECVNEVYLDTALLQSHLLPFLVGPTKDGRIHMDELPDSIDLTIAAIRYHGNGESLEHLRDTHPLQPHHAPALFHDITTVPSEFWYLFQDCFFLTPGVHDVLVEFLPE